MKKENFITLVLGTLGGMLFALGMCMCLLAQWDAFREGVVVGAAGAAVLFVMLAVRRKMLGKPAVKVDAKMVGKVVLGILGALVLGVGMCMVMVWEGLLVQGIVVGIVGILLLLSLIPLCIGVK